MLHRWTKVLRTWEAPSALREPPEFLTPVPKGISIPPPARSASGLPPCWVGEEEEGAGSQGHELGWQCWKNNICQQESGSVLGDVA